MLTSVRVTFVYAARTLNDGRVGISFVTNVAAVHTRRARARIKRSLCIQTERARVYVS